MSSLQEVLEPVNKVVDKLTNAKVYRKSYFSNIILPVRIEVSEDIFAVILYT